MFLFLFKKKTIRPLKILLDIKDLMVMGGSPTRRTADGSASFR